MKTIFALGLVFSACCVMQAQNLETPAPRPNPPLPYSATVDPVEGSEAQWPGEAKISGRAIAAGPITEGADGDRFHAEIAEVVHTHLNEEATLLVVEWWTPTHGLRR